MKKIITLLALTLVMIGCKPKEKVVGTQLDQKMERALKGEWNITSVKYPGSDYITVTSFDIADSKCFVGSSWKFVSNNNKGDMALNTCSKFSSPITWYINKDGNFVMKILNGTKARKLNEGYILRVVYQDDTSFQLIDQINVGGKITDVLYQFKKI